MSRALAGLASAEGLRGYEREVSDQLVRAGGRETRTGSSFLVPTSLALSRDLTVGTASAGGYLVGTENVTFIDALRNRSICAAMGATFMAGLKGNVTIPKQTAAATAQWLANEGTAITESQQTLGQVALTPKNVGAYTEFSRQLLMQSNPAVDRLIMDDLAKVIGLAVDAAAINGSGASGQPTGILNTAGIGSVSGTSLGYTGCMGLVSTLGTANALDESGSVGFVTTPTVAALLMQRQRFTSTDSPVWEGNLLDGTVAGLRAMSSNGMPSATMLAGNWQDLVIGESGHA
ncbi:MAG: phage major capsid protein [Rhodocyclaceae bacterium]|nr:phage major capsid protein [Rhodocyclaceae bacterium]